MERATGSRSASANCPLITAHPCVVRIFVVVLNVHVPGVPAARRLAAPGHPSRRRSYTYFVRSHKSRRCDRSRKPSLLVYMMPVQPPPAPKTPDFECVWCPRLDGSRRFVSSSLSASPLESMQHLRGVGGSGAPMG